MSRKPRGAAPHRSSQQASLGNTEKVASSAASPANPTSNFVTEASTADDPDASSIATREWWEARLARQFGDGVLRAQVDSANDEVVLLGQLGADDFATLQDFIESSGQSDRVRSLVEPV